MCIAPPIELSGEQRTTLEVAEAACALVREPDRYPPLRNCSIALVNRSTGRWPVQ